MDININVDKIKEKINTFINKFKDKGNIKSRVVLDINREKSIITIYNLSSHDSLVSLFTVPFNYGSLTEDYSKTIENIITEYIIPKFNLKDLSLFVIFPNEVITLDMITLPVVNKKKMKDALNTMINSNYKNVNDLVIKSDELITEKDNYIYEVSLIRRDIVSNLMNGLTMNKVYPKSITYTANGLNAGVVRLYPKMKDKSFILFDIKDDTSNIVLTHRGRTIGFYTFNFGYNIIESNKIYDLKDLFEHNNSLNLIDKELNKNKVKEVEEVKKETETKERKYNAISERKNISSNYSYEDLERLKLGISSSEENFKNFIMIHKLLAKTYKEKNENYLFDNIIYNIDPKYNSLINKLYEKEDENIIILRDSVDNNKDVIVNNLGLYGAIFTLEQNKNIIS